MKQPRHVKNLRYVNGKWISEITLNGKRVRRFVGFTKEQALNALAKMRLDKLNERLGFKTPGTGGDVPFDEFADEFLELYSRPNKRSWRGDEILLGFLKEFFKGEPLRSIGPEAVTRFMAERRAEVSPATSNRTLAVLKTLFAKAVEWGKLETNPVTKVKKFKEPPGRERILTPDEAKRLIEAASPELRPVLLISLNTGMRRNEILSLKWRAVDMGGGFLTVETSKSGKSRKVPMNALVRETLRALPRLPAVEYVFYNPKTKTHIKDVKTGFRAACARSAIKVRLHDLRHTFATWYVAAGGDLVALSRILGHASIQMTMRYAHPTPEVMRLGVERVGAFFDPARQNNANPPEVIKSAPRTIDYRNYI